MGGVSDSGYPSTIIAGRSPVVHRLNFRYNGAVEARRTAAKEAGYARKWNIENAVGFGCGR
jgi:hypothetical protein